MAEKNDETGITPFEVQIVGAAVIIRCHANIDKDHIDDLLKVLSNFSAKSHNPPIKSLAFDFKNQVEVEITAFRKIAPILKKLKTQGVTIFAVNGTANLENFLKKNGLDNLIRLFDHIKEKLAGNMSQDSQPTPDATQARNKLGPEAFAALIKSVVQIFKVQCEINLVPSKPYPRPKTYVYTADISGVSEICIEGNQGRIAICFSEALFLKVIGKMLKKEVANLDPKLKDLAAEFLNIALGQAKTSFVDSGYVFSFEIPRAVILKEDKSPLTEDPSVILPFSCPEGDFQLEVSFPLV